MTLKKNDELVKTIREVIEKYIFMNELKVAGTIFDEKNRFYVEKSAKAVSEKALIFNGEDFIKGDDPEKVFDVAILDFLPVRYMSELALGLYNDNFSRTIGKMIIEGKIITVLRKSPEITDKTPPAFVGLIENYRKILESYGIVFMPEPAKKIKTETKTSNSFFGGKVLTKTDILTIPQGTVLNIGNKTLITDLAKETAELKKIELIVRSGD